VALNKLRDMYMDKKPGDTVGRVNRLISAWPQDDALPTEGYQGVKAIRKKLDSGLREIKSQADSEVK
jgi:SAGA-associated factor 29